MSIIRDTVIEHVAMHPETKRLRLKAADDHRRLRRHLERKCDPQLTQFH
jgi:hypothetical protein